MAPQRDQEPPERDMIRHAGVADRTEKHGIVGPQLIEPVFRHHAAGLGVGLAAPVELAPLQRKAVAPRCRFQRVDALRHDFAPDAVAGDNGDPICSGHRLPPLCGGRLAHSAGSAPAGSTYASGVYIAAKALASPLLKAAIHSAFSFSIELLACAQAGEADSRKQARKIAMRAIGTLPGRGGLSRDFA